MEYYIKITDGSTQANSLINLLQSLAKDYDFLEVLDKPDELFKISKEQQEELDRRFEYVLQNPDKGKSWEEIEAKLLSK